jgi:hypothetical protein
MRYPIIALFLLVLLSCCDSTILVEARITRIEKKIHTGNCPHANYFYELVKYPTYIGFEKLIVENNLTLAVNDTTLMRIQKWKIEDLMNLYPEKE